MLESYNSINLYENCPFSYHLKYNLKQRIPNYNLKIITGMIIHSFLEQYYSSFKPVKDVEYWEFKDGKTYYLEKDFFSIQLKEVEKIFKNFKKIIKDTSFLSLKRINSKETLTEKKIFDKVILGNIDLLLLVSDEQAFIIDYKTGSSYFQKFDQLKFYATLVFQRYPTLTNVMLIEYFVNENKLFKQLYSKQEALLLREKIDEKVKIIKEDTQFKKNENNCKLCMYQEHCKIYTHIQELKNKLTSSFKKKIFIGEGNYASKEIIIFPKPTLEQFTSGTKKHEIFENLYINNYLVLFMDFFYSSKSKTLSDKYKDDFMELLLKINPTKISFIGKEAYELFSGTKVEDTIYNKTMAISLNKETFIKCQVLKENSEEELYYSKKIQEMREEDV